MDKYEVIKKIINSGKISESDKVYCIETFLKGWSTEEEIKWIWEQPDN